MNSYETALLSNNIKMNQTENCTELVAYIESVDLFMQFYYLTYINIHKIINVIHLNFKFTRIHFILKPRQPE